MNRILKSFENKTIFITLFCILFVISSIFAFKGFYTMFPIISHSGRGSLTYLPTIILFIIPLITLCYLFIYKHCLNYASKHRVLKSYSITMTIISFFAFLIQFINMFISFGWNSIGKNISPLFPYDVLIILLAILCLSIYLIVYSFKTIKEEKIEKTIEEKVKKRYLVLFSIYLCVATYFFGAAFHSIYLLIGGITDTWYLSLPYIFILVLMTMNGIFYLVYKHKNNDKRLFLLFYIISISVTVFFVTYGIISACVCPYIISRDLTPLFFIDHSSSLPIAGVFLFIGIVIPEITAFIFLIKSFKKSK
ncbi:MAG: hypothetical protein ACI31G_04980 [Bacilli bacterium]